jgi:hypothetical protein
MRTEEEIRTVINNAENILKDYYIYQVSCGLDPAIVKAKIEAFIWVLEDEN